MDFMRYIQINFNPAKCKMIVHSAYEELVANVFLPDESETMIDIQACEINDIVKYLGILLGTRKLTKLKFNNDKRDNLRKILDMFKDSDLKIMQIINVIKTFVSPRLTDVIMNRVIGRTELNRLDEYKRKIINDLIGNILCSKTYLHIIDI
jgi:hypothetical protein